MFVLPIMFEQKVKVFIGASLIGVGVLQAVSGFYSDNLALIGVGVLLVVLNVAYVYQAIPRSEH